MKGIILFVVYAFSAFFLHEVYGKVWDEIDKEEESKKKVLMFRMLNGLAITLQIILIILTMYFIAWLLV